MQDFSFLRNVLLGRAMDWVSTWTAKKCCFTTNSTNFKAILEGNMTFFHATQKLKYWCNLNFEIRIFCLCVTYSLKKLKLALLSLPILRSP